jgi:hypothetical protein
MVIPADLRVGTWNIHRYGPMADSRTKPDRPSFDTPCESRFHRLHGLFSGQL